MSKHQLFIKLMGNPSIVIDQNDITTDISAKSAGIIYYLAVNPSHSKDKIAFIFWEDSDAHSARYNLRYNIWNINKLLAGKYNCQSPLICTDKGQLSISTDYELKLDIDLYQRELADCTIDQLLGIKNRYCGEFLSDLYLKNCLQFNDWVFFEREKYQRKHYNVLHLLLAHYKQNLLYQEAIDIVKIMLSFNAYDEDLYVEMIKLLIQLGDRSTALRQYDKCIHMLRDELNVSPKTSTECLLKVIKSTHCTQDGCSKQSTSNIVWLSENSDYADIDDNIAARVIRLCAIPVDGEHYLFLSQLIDRLLVVTTADILNQLNPSVVAVLAHINHTVPCNISMIVPTNTVAGEQTRLFCALIALIKVGCQQAPLSIVIENIDQLDSIAFSFLKYLLFLIDNFACTVYIKSDALSPKYLELKQFYKF